MFVELDPAAEEPLFQQLYRGIVGGIARGEIPDGTKLEPVRSVAASFGINPATVKKAYDLLRADGLIDSKARARAVVHLPSAPTRSHADQLRSELEHLVNRARCLGMTADDISQMLTELLDKEGAR